MPRMCSLKARQIASVVEAGMFGIHAETSAALVINSSKKDPVIL